MSVCFSQEMCQGPVWHCTWGRLMRCPEMPHASSKALTPWRVIPCGQLGLLSAWQPLVTSACTCVHLFHNLRGYCALRHSLSTSPISPALTGKSDRRPELSPCFIPGSSVPFRSITQWMVSPRGGVPHPPGDSLVPPPAASSAPLGILGRLFPAVAYPLCCF